MRKLFLILTIVCLLATVTIINAIPVSAGTLTITPTVGGPEEGPDPEMPPPGQQDPSPGPGPVITAIEVAIPQVADDALVRAAELNPILEYVPDPDPGDPHDPGRPTDPGRPPDTETPDPGPSPMPILRPSACQRMVTSLSPIPLALTTL
jgi:hypothetical protein